MATSTNLPPQRLQVLDKDGAFTLPWYRWYQGVQGASSGGITPAEVATLINAALAPVIADVADAQATADEALLEAAGINVLTLVSLSDLDGYHG